MRLLLVEFFPGTLRRNEKGMLFPFVKGLAAELGFETRWLCFGGALAPAAEGYGGRMLRAELSEEDLATLEGELRSFRPSHAITTDLLCTEAEALLDALTPRPEHLVMPTVSDIVFGSPEASGLARAMALFSGDPARDDYLGRCGGFLRFLGVDAPALAGEYLVARADPDYSAVLANAEARVSQAPISIVSGSLCGNRSRLSKNPVFGQLDLGEFREHRGCAFCMSATIPPYTPADVDPLPLWERQLRRMLESAGGGGRDTRVYEFFDYRAFRVVDEVAGLVTRLGLPPSAFMFNPRIDEVLHARERMERALPMLAGAGHEVRILSMGVENFSEAENARLNKGITLAQVDELLALARGWEAAHPGVFLPFKAGYRNVELGFILYTPWTTLADLRLNLDCATERHFSEGGYWLYSTLDIQKMEPMYRLAQAAGDVLCDRFQDRGQVYGVFLNESEVGHLVPWRFRDAGVADFFAVVVRVCAAHREGRQSVFFRDDPEFAVIEQAYREANVRQPITPLAVARGLLEVIEAGPAPGPRTALLRVALDRIARRPESTAAPVEPRSAANAPALAGGAVTRSSTADVVARVVDGLAHAGPGAFSEMEFQPIAEIGPPEARRIRLAFSLAGRNLIVDLHDARSDGPCFLRTRRFRAVYHRDTPITSAHQRQSIARLLSLIERGLDGAR